MELSSILIALVFTLGATAICVILFQHLGFGSVLGLIVGRYLLPAVLGYTARQRHMDAFGIVLFLAVIAAAWAVDQVGISMTLGAFLMGMLLSASAYVTTAEPDRAEGLAVTLHRLYPHLNVYVRVHTLREQDKLVARGIKKAGTSYIESTLVRGAMLLKDLGMSESDVNELVKAFQNHNYALIRAAFAEPAKPKWESYLDA
jgi:hypothetical protein